MANNCNFSIQLFLGKLVWTFGCLGFLSGKAGQTPFLKDHDRWHADNKTSFKRALPVAVLSYRALKRSKNGVCIPWESLVVSWAPNSYLGSAWKKGNTLI